MLFKNLQEDHPLQHLPSLLVPQQDRGAQHHLVCRGVHHLPSHPWVHLYQEGQRDQKVQDFPSRRMNIHTLNAVTQ